MIHAITDGVRRIDHVTPVGDRRERRRHKEFPELPHEEEDDSTPAAPAGRDAPAEPRTPESDEDEPHKVDIRVCGLDVEWTDLPGGQSLPCSELSETLH